MPIGLSFRLLGINRYFVQAIRSQWWDTRRPASVDVGSGYGISVDDTDPVEQVRNLVTTGPVMAQATSGDRPTVDSSTIPGALLIETINNDHMHAAVSGQLAAVAIAFRDDGASSERFLLARDTSAVTDKPAFDLAIILD